MKHTEYFIQSRGLPLLSREEAESLSITQESSMFAFAYSGSAGISMCSWHLAIHGHVVFKELRLSLRTTCLHYLPTHVAHDVPLSKKTFSLRCLPCPGQRPAPGQTCRRPPCSCAVWERAAPCSYSMHTFWCILISRMCLRIPLWGKSEVALDLLPRCSRCCVSGTKFSSSTMAVPAQWCQWRHREEGWLNAFETLASLFNSLCGS